jgi:hypothetical protein
VPIRAATTKRTVCKETLPSLVTTFTNMELKIKAIESPKQEAIANYVGREYSKEMRLLVKNQEENEPKEPVMPDKEEAKLPLVIKKYGTELKQHYFKKERY